ncbi:MFS transporter [Chloroflexi bacterium TSY]|nr:MFS transporter [Chloroflexi bacterium TSY]
MNATLWHNSSFLRLWIAQAISNAGSQITNVALPLTAVLILGATPTQMGLLGMANSLPNLLFGLPAGVWVDRTRRRPILVGSDLGRALLLGSIPLAAWLGHISFMHLWLVAFLAGILTVFFQIASISILPSIVPKEQLVEANSKLSLSDSVISIAGPGIAGGLVQFFSAPKAIVIDAVSYILSAVALRRLETKEALPTRKPKTIWHEVGEGIYELIRTPLLKVLTITSALGMLAGALQNTVQLLFFANELNFSPATIGFVLAAGGIGTLSGAASAGWLAYRLRAGTILALGKSIWIVGSLLIVFAGLGGNAFVYVIAGQAVVGFGMSIYFVNQVSLRQVITSVALLGRVTAARRFVLFGMAVFGAALGGFLGEVVGLRLTLLIGTAALTGELLLIILSPIRHAHV